MTIFEAFGILRPSRSKTVGVGSGLFVSLPVSDVLCLHEIPVIDDQNILRHVCIGIGL